MDQSTAMLERGPVRTRLRGFIGVGWILLLSLSTSDALNRPSRTTTASTSYSLLPTKGSCVISKRPAFVVGQSRVLELRAGASSKDEDEDSDEEDEEEEDEIDNDDDDVDSDDDDEDSAPEEKTAVTVDDDEDSDEEYEEEEDEEYEADEEDDEEEEDDVAVAAANGEATEQTYDEPLVPSAFANIYVTFGVMMIAKRLDLTSPKVAALARGVYIGYIIVLQLFLAYVRIKAKEANNRTPITVNNPLSSALQGQLDGLGGGANGMVKMLASSLLSSSTSVMEYDLKEAKNMQRGLLFNMAFQWFLHFKMKQVQPLLIQTGSGFLNMFYSPLFQVYVLGRNLERPFKTNTSSMAKLQELQAQAAEAQAKAEGATELSEAVPTKQITAEEKDVTDTSDSEEEDDDDDDEDGMKGEEEDDDDDETRDDDDDDDDDDEATTEAVADDDDDDDSDDEDD